MTSLPSPNEFAVSPERRLRGLLEMAKGSRQDALISFIAKALTEARDSLDAVTLAKLAADLAAIRAGPVHAPEPESHAVPPALHASQPADFQPAQDHPVTPLHTDEPEDEILGLVGDMREVALRFRGTLAKDVAKLEKTRELQEEQISSVSREQKKSAELRSSGKIGFFCTLLLIAISVLLSAALVPFIIVTR